ncbi:MAG TPA: NAD(P)-dependent oxidoreductase [Chthoniobacteraceae bacterium]|jgi:D-lactate dehydrogenase
MKICFVQLERTEHAYFAGRLSEHEITFVDKLREVPEETEIASVFIDERVTAEFLARVPALRMITTRSRSVDHLDLPACAARRVVVSSVPFSGETTVSEHTFALILALSRRLREVMALPHAGRFSYEGTRGMELAGKTLGIIGMGCIGRRVAMLANAFEMKVIAYDVEPDRDAAETLHFSYVPLPELLGQSDVISLHATLRPETYHILNRETLALCRPGVLLINTARGALIETEALREALDSGQIGGAGLDVLQDERILRRTASKIIGDEIVQHLRSDAVAQEAHDTARVRELQEVMLGDAILAKMNVVFTPHVAFNSIEAFERLQDGTIENIQSFARGTPVNVVG